MRTHLAVGLVAGIACGSLLPLEAQSLTDRVSAVQNGTVRMSYAAREGVCGNGRNINTSSRSREWEHDCEPGPVRVAIEKHDGVATEIRTYVGGRWRPGDNVTDLGTVSAPRAAEFFMGLAERSTELRGDVIAAGVFADSAMNTSALLRIARATSVRKSTRRQAVFWLSQEAGDAAVKGLTELADDQTEDQDIRKQAVFALSQLDEDQGIPVLIRVATQDRDPVIRKQAIFWLGQSKDPRALDLFEKILTGKAPLH